MGFLTQLRNLTISCETQAYSQFFQVDFTKPITTNYRLQIYSTLIYQLSPYRWSRTTYIDRKLRNMHIDFQIIKHDFYNIEVACNIICEFKNRQCLSMTCFSRKTASFRRSQRKISFTQRMPQTGKNEILQIDAYLSSFGSR